MSCEDPVPVLGMDAGSSAVGTMQSTSSSLFNTPGSRHEGTSGSTNISGRRLPPYLIAHFKQFVEPKRC